MPFTHLNGVRLGTEGRYCVTNGKMFFRVFCLFCSADILSLKLTSEPSFIYKVIELTVVA